MSLTGEADPVAPAAAAQKSDAEKIAELIPDVIQIADLERVYAKLILKVAADRKRAGAPQNVDAWEVVTLAGGDLAALKLAACQAAEAGGFLAGLAEGLGQLANLLASESEPTATQVNNLMRAAVGGYGYMQAIAAANRGYLNPALIDKLPHIMRATGYVSAGAIIGTAFLVGPDTVLTAAHVAFDAAGQLRPNLRFTFADPADEAPRPRHFEPKPGQSLVSHSPAYGTFPNARRVLSMDADNHLDYAVIRLASRVNGIKPIEIAPQPQNTSGANVFIFGYHGGNAMRVDVFAGITTRTPGKRFIHALNAVQGMSGSPCIGPSGHAIGVHEAGFQTVRNGETLIENRAVDARHIYGHILASTGTNRPLAPLNSATDYGIYNAAARQAWAKRGQELAGPQFADAWKRAVLSIGDPAPSSDGAVLAFHPLFDSGSERVVEWARRIREKTTFQRVASITSTRRGAGASFAIDRLAAVLDDQGQLFRYDVSQGGAKAPHEILGVAAGPDPARPEAGWTKYDLVTAAIDLIDNISGNNKPVFVAIDLATSALTDDALDIWTAFVHALIAREDVGLLLISPPPGLDLTAGAKLPDGTAFDAMSDLQAIEIGVPNDGHIVNCLRALSTALSKPPPSANDLAAAKASWIAATGSANVPVELAAVQAVWLVLSVMAAHGLVQG